MTKTTAKKPEALTQAPDSPPLPGLPTSPFVGLEPFSEAHRDYFFGREDDSRRISSQVASARLTILYGESGVGKTSALRAGVVPHIQQHVRNTFCVVYRDWGTRNPAQKLADAIAEGARRASETAMRRISSEIEELKVQAQNSSEESDGEFWLEEIEIRTDRLRSLEAFSGGKTEDSRSGFPIVDTVKPINRHLGLSPVIFLDQFEEFLGSRSDLQESLDSEAPPLSAEGERIGWARLLDKELARLVNDRDVSVHLCICLRKDSLYMLDLLRDRIPEIMENRICLDFMDESGARRAIEEPLKRYFKRGQEIARSMPAEEWPTNRQEAPWFEYRVAGEIVDDILDPRTQRLTMGLEGRGGVDDNMDSDRLKATTPIQAPYLQLILTTLWEHRPTTPAKSDEEGSILLSTDLYESLGKARGIVTDHVDLVMATLSSEHQARCAKFFDRLVTPSGYKFAYSVLDLAQLAFDVEHRAELTDAQIEETRQILEKLVDNQLLRWVSDMDSAIGSGAIPKAITESQTGKKQRRFPSRSRSTAGPGETDESDKSGVEVLHDILGNAILLWQRGFLVSQGFEEDVKKKLQDQKETFDRRVTAIGIGIGLLIVILFFVVGAQLQVNAKNAQLEAERAQLRGAKMSFLIADRVKSNQERDARRRVLLALKSVELAQEHKRPLEPRKNALRQVLHENWSQADLITRDNLWAGAALSKNGRALALVEGGAVKTATSWAYSEAPSWQHLRAVPGLTLANPEAPTLMYPDNSGGRVAIAHGGRVWVSERDKVSPLPLDTRDPERPGSNLEGVTCFEADGDLSCIAAGDARGYFYIWTREGNDWRLAEWEIPSEQADKPNPYTKIEILKQEGSVTVAALRADGALRVSRIAVQGQTATQSKPGWLWCAAPNERDHFSTMVERASGSQPSGIRDVPLVDFDLFAANPADNDGRDGTPTRSTEIGLFTSDILGNCHIVELGEQKRILATRWLHLTNAERGHPISSASCETLHGGDNIRFVITRNTLLSFWDEGWRHLKESGRPLTSEPSTPSSKRIPTKARGRREIQPSYEGSLVMLSGDGTRVLHHAFSSSRVFSPKTQLLDLEFNQSMELRGYRKNPMGLRFDRDSQSLTILSSNSDRIGIEIRTWSLDSQSPSSQLLCHPQMIPQGVGAIAGSILEGRLSVLLLSDRSLLVGDLEGESFATHQLPGVAQAAPALVRGAISENGRTIIGAFADGSLCRWWQEGSEEKATATWTRHQELIDRGQAGPSRGPSRFRIDALAVSPDGESWAAALGPSSAGVANEGLPPRIQFGWSNQTSPPTPIREAARQLLWVTTESDDGQERQWVVAVGVHGTLSILDPLSGEVAIQEIVKALQSDREILRVSEVHQGRNEFVALSATDQLIRYHYQKGAWHEAGTHPLVVTRTATFMGCRRLDPDTLRVKLGSDDGFCEMWTLRPGEIPEEGVQRFLDSYPAPIMRAQLCELGGRNYLITMSKSGLMRRWVTETDELIALARGIVSGTKKLREVEQEFFLEPIPHKER